MASYENISSRGRGWLNRIKLWKLIIILSIILITVPLVAHYYLSSIGDEGQLGQGRRSRSTMNHNEEPNCCGQPSSLRSQIEELKRIKASVNKELVEMESRQQKLRVEIQGYNTHIEKLKNQYETTNKDLEKLKVSIEQARIAMAEAAERNMPEIHAPLRILPSADDEVYISPPFLPHSCSMHSCFDYSRCALSSQFPVYFYNPDNKDFPSIELNSLVKEAVKSVLGGTPYRTHDATAACVFIVLVGESNVLNNKAAFQEQLYNLPHWKGDGRNHILLNLAMTNTHRDIFQGVNTGRAMLAQSSFTANQFRPGFDIVLPPNFGRVSGDLWDDLQSLVPLRKKYLLSFIGEYTRRGSNGTLANQIGGDKYIQNGVFSNQGDLNSARILTVNPNNHDRHILSVQEITSDDIFVVSTLKKMYMSTQDSFFFQYSCDKEGVQDEPTVWTLCSPDLKRHEVLKQSTFSLILAPSNFSLVSTISIQTRLYEALKYGAVPVIVGEHLRLPFEDILDWRQAAIIVPSARITELHFFIRTISDPDLFQLRYTGRLYFEQYMGSTKHILNTLLAVLRFRLQIPPLPTKAEPSPSIFDNSTVPLKMDAADIEPESDEVLGPTEPPFPSQEYTRNFTISREVFHHPGDPFHLYPHTPFQPLLGSEAKFLGSGLGFRPIGKGAGGSGKEFNEALGGNLPREQFTIVMLTYERESVLINAIQRLKGLPFLNKVVVVWNSPGRPSPDLRWPDIGVPVHVVKTSKNSLNNRFLPYDVIETEAVLSIDDDAHLRHDEIVFGFRVWREARERVVGFPGRFHAWDVEHTGWHYNSNYSCELSMVLTGAAFIHKYYLYLYSYVMPQAIRDKVDEYLNCEDIAMNFLVSHITRQPPIKVTSRWTFRCPGCPQALSVDDSHFQERHKCINFFAKVYGYMPLLYTQFRVDSVLFKTRISHDKQKCFRFI
ncbi:exostosin-like 3 [Lingula anatina]|uniref:glucuronosyl-galactosyl-proteoglycan 4-alpha-N-acetylglucosaminyltransferase n=1 Tax=Lingula anatina TaxID=7574 RepID=A0A1S3H4Q0_LINAN|nr:exostosin-like 3 [Lingula anatina]|eukprot:XP_013380983.1 exostosin-like 3 [Lingula anatina]